MKLTTQSVNPVTEFAGEQLSLYLGRMFPGTGSGSQLHFIFTNCPKNDLQFDGYEILISEDCITIASLLPRGILYGVYEFLRLLGCRFLFSRPELERVPVLEEFELSEQVIMKNPQLEYRGLALYQVTHKTIPETIHTIDWMTKNNYNFLLTSVHRTDDSPSQGNAILWDETSKYLYPELVKRGTMIDMSEHSTDQFFPRDELFREHPEWFALINGERRSLQICYSNLDAVQRYADSFAEFAKTHHDFKFLGLWPLDGGGYCKCEHCQDPLTIMKANQVVAEAVGKVRPDLTVEFLAYTPESFTCPEEELPKNMSVLVCDKYDKVGYDWGRMARSSGGAFFFDYMTGDNCRFRANVWINPFYCRDIVNTIQSYRYRGMVSLFLPITNWWQPCINYWYLSKLYYEPMVSIEDLTNELAYDMFGDENSELMSEILIKIYTELQDRTLWSRVPHAQPHYHARLTDRHVEMDALHRDRLEQTLRELERMLEQVNCEMFSETEALQMDHLNEYLQLQWLFFTCIDQYNLETDTPEEVKPYLQAVAKLEKCGNRGFISYTYAESRILDSDDVLVEL